VHATDCVGRTPLHFAAANGRMSQLRALLAAGAHAGARNCYGTTPLHLAALSGAREAAVALLAAGAEIDAANNGGWTPLQYAIRGGEAYHRTEMVQLLVRNACSARNAMQNHARRRSSTGERPARRSRVGGTHRRSTRIPRRCARTATPCSRADQETRGDGQQTTSDPILQALRLSAQRHGSACPARD